MKIFLDTSAIIAVLNNNDQFHLPAKQAWQTLLSGNDILVSSNYILLETIVLLQHRFGITAVRLFQNEVLPVIEIVWINEQIHSTAASALLVANRRDLSLVDCTSFEIIRQASINQVFTFDPHFEEQGFVTISHKSG